jgi:hypothetical protein
MSRNLGALTLLDPSGSAWPVMGVLFTLAFALQLRKKHGKTSVRVVEKCPDIPVAVVQYTFTHKQYTEQHNDTEWNIHNNKNT